MIGGMATYAVAIAKGDLSTSAEKMDK